MAKKNDAAVEEKIEEAKVEAAKVEEKIEEKVSDSDEKAKLKESVAEVKAKVAAEEIQGASESSIHALIEQLKRLNAKLDGEPEDKSKQAKRRKYFPF